MPAKVTKIMMDRSGGSFLSSVYQRKEARVHKNNLNLGRHVQSKTMKANCKVLLKLFKSSVL